MNPQRGHFNSHSLKLHPLKRLIEDLRCIQLIEDVFFIIEVNPVYFETD